MVPTGHAIEEFVESGAMVFDPCMTQFVDDDVIDQSAGILLRKKVGDPVKEGEVLLELHTNAEDESLLERSVLESRAAYEISDEPQKAPDVVAGYIAS